MMVANTNKFHTVKKKKNNTSPSGFKDPDASHINTFRLYLVLYVVLYYTFHFRSHATNLIYNTNYEVV